MVLQEPPIAGTEVDTLIGSLERQRRIIAWKCGGLDAEGVRAATAASTITLGGLLKHLALIEDDYFQHRLMGRSPGKPWEDIDWDADPEWEWRTGSEDPPGETMALWQAAVERSRATTAEALAQGGLDLRAKGVSDPEGNAPSFRRILIDVIEEYARHAGHADIVRESIDGVVGEDPPD
jgi:hypothetical protein